jgi:hypothetical protein
LTGSDGETSVIRLEPYLFLFYFPARNPQQFQDFLHIIIFVCSKQNFHTLFMDDLFSSRIQFSAMFCAMAQSTLLRVSSEYSRRINAENSRVERQPEALFLSPRLKEVEKIPRCPQVEWKTHADLYHFQAYHLHGVLHSSVPLEEIIEMHDHTDTHAEENRQTAYEREGELDDWTFDVFVARVASEEEKGAEHQVQDQNLHECLKPETRMRIALWIVDDDGHVEVEERDKNDDWRQSDPFGKMRWIVWRGAILCEFETRH